MAAATMCMEGSQIASKSQAKSCLCQQADTTDESPLGGKWGETSLYQTIS